MTARFTSPDPTIPDPFDLQSLNRASYVRNSPMDKVDPTGFAEAPPPAEPPKPPKKEWVTGTGIAREGAQDDSYGAAGTHVITMNPAQLKDGKNPTRPSVGTPATNDANGLAGENDPLKKNRDGLAGVVASARNKIATTKNSSVNIDVKGVKIGVDRGEGNDVKAKAETKAGDITASGTISSQPHVVSITVNQISTPLGTITSQPSVVRILDSSKGDLRYEFDKPFTIRVFGFSVVDLKAGQYIIPGKK